MEIKLGNIFNRLKSSSQGMTLIEVLIALAIMAFVATAFLGALGTTFITAKINEEEINAERLAKSTMDYIKSQVYYIPGETDPYQIIDSTGYYIYPIDFPDRIQYIDPGSEDVTSDNDTGIQRITVEVCSGNDTCDKPLFKLVGYKLK